MEITGLPDLPRVMTIGQAAAALGVPVHRLTYAYRSGHLPEPAQRAGNYRILTREDIALALAYLAGGRPPEEALPHLLTPDQTP